MYLLRFGMDSARCQEMRTQDFISEWISYRLHLTNREIYTEYKDKLGGSMDRKTFSVKISRVRNRNKKDVKRMVETNELKERIKNKISDSIDSPSFISNDNLSALVNAYRMISDIDDDETMNRQIRENTRQTILEVGDMAKTALQEIDKIKMLLVEKGLL